MMHRFQVWGSGFRALGPMSTFRMASLCTFKAEIGRRSAFGPCGARGAGASEEIHLSGWPCCAARVKKVEGVIQRSRLIQHPGIAF